MSDLGISNVPSNTQDFATIPDVSVETLTDRVVPRQVTSGVTRGVQQLGSTKIYSDGGNSRIVIEDDTNTRVFIGKLPDNTFGVAISKAGYDVEDAFS